MCVCVCVIPPTQPMCNQKEDSLDRSLAAGGDDGDSVRRSESPSALKRRTAAVDENNNHQHDGDHHTTKEQTSRPGLVSRLKLFVDRNVNRFETEIRWPHVIFMLAVHLVSLHALFLVLAFRVKLQTILFAVFLHYLCNVGLTAGVHRLWSHKGEAVGRECYG